MPWLVVVRAILTLPDGWPARRLDRWEMQRLLLKGKLKGKLKAKVQLLAENAEVLRAEEDNGNGSGVQDLIDLILQRVPYIEVWFMNFILSYNCIS